MLAYLFVLLAIAVRFLPFAGPLNFLPHAWHFTPLAASLLFFGARGPRRQMWIPVAMLVATDLILTKLMYSTALTWDQIVIWAWYGGIVLLGDAALRRKSGFLRVVGAALTSSVSFFVVSNFAVWAAWPQLYGRTFSGLVACYTAAIPFFRGTLESDLFFSIAMFQVPVLLHALSAWMERAGDQNAAA